MLQTHCSDAVASGGTARVARRQENRIGYRLEAGSLLNRRRHSHFCGDSNAARCIPRKARHWR